jgi:hypothetical protein
MSADGQRQVGQAGGVHLQLLAERVGLADQLCGCRLIIRPAQAACWYSWRVPPSRSRRWMSRGAICPGLLVGSGKGRRC